jgi:hypothetical protein
LQQSESDSDGEDEGKDKVKKSDLNDPEEEKKNL